MDIARRAMPFGAVDRDPVLQGLGKVQFLMLDVTLTPTRCTLNTYGILTNAVLQPLGAERDLP